MHKREIKRKGCLNSTNQIPQGRITIIEPITGIPSNFTQTRSRRMEHNRVKTQPNHEHDKSEKDSYEIEELETILSINSDDEID